jgi:putative endonuclease
LPGQAIFLSRKAQAYKFSLEINIFAKKTKDMVDHLELGREGEERARELLRSKGYKILECNWRCSFGEIDIIAKDGEVLVIVEVKTRATSFFGDPELAVNRKKQKNIIRMADNYIKYKGLDLEVRFDIVSVIISNGKCEIHHIPDAFYPTL